MNALSHFGGSVARAIILVSGFSMVAEAQVSQQNRQFASEQTPQIAPTELPPAPNDAADSSNAIETRVPESPASSTIPMSPSISQVELPFSDVSPDHWAYEALLFLSTGHRQ